MSNEFTSALGALSSSITFGGREAVKDGALEGYVLVIGFPAGLLTDSSYPSVLAGMTATTKIKLVDKTIGGLEVSTGTSAAATMSVFHVGDHVIMVVTNKGGPAIAIATALISANG